MGWGSKKNEDSDPKPNRDDRRNARHDDRTDKFHAARNRSAGKVEQALTGARQIVEVALDEATFKDEMKMGLIKSFKKVGNNFKVVYK